MYNAYQNSGLSSPVFFAVRARLPAYIAALLLGMGAAPAMGQAMLLPTAQLMVQGHAVQAEIAATEQSRSYGLMNRASLPEDHGMLFVFEQADKVCFWMKNTPLPLSIAFIDDQGKITNIESMQPQTLQAHCPVRPIRYALEMEQGWFSLRQIGPGAVVENLPRP